MQKRPNVCPTARLLTLGFPLANNFLCLFFYSFFVQERRAAQIKIIQNSGKRIN